MDTIPVIFNVTCILLGVYPVVSCHRGIFCNSLLYKLQGDILGDYLSD